jgi:fructosamine-3-kinase
MSFWRARLANQLERAARRGYGGALQAAGERLIGNLDRYLADHEPAASLLHGDLWGGNWAAVAGRPVIFDPAVYYGDRETDLAMTRLFGGFGPAFYRAYDEAWPLSPGHEQRLGLYQLYHVLNHLNLFGRGYLGRALEIIHGLNQR